MLNPNQYRLWAVRLAFVPLLLLMPHSVAAKPISYPGGTMVMIVGACTDRYRAIFALGPVASPAQYGGDYLYCDPNNEKEVALRSPILWLHSVTSPMYVFEGAANGNWDAVQLMVDRNANPAVQFFKVPGHDRFSVIAPLTEKLAAQIVKGQINVTQETLLGLR